MKELEVFGVEGKPRGKFTLSVHMIKMRACWMFMILLSCRPSHATNSESSCACKDQLKIICVPAGDYVSVPCPKLTGVDVTYNLYKEEEVIQNHTCTQDKNSSNCTPRYTRVGVELHKNTENKSVSFILTGVNASSYGFYRCEVTVMFPPPFIKSTSWILVRVEGHQCKFKKDSIEPITGVDQKEGFLWIWILGLVVLCIYSLIITIIAGVTWVKWRGSNSQSDYMNTKPKAHKKRRGVQIPIQRHF